jgi:hypothetical protein
MVRSFVPACLVWVVWLLMALRWWGMGSSTLLGPEGSAGLRSRVGEPPVGVPLLAGGGGCCFWSSLCSSCPCVLVVLVGLCLWGWLGWVWGVLVGLLFEICIVDASIL